MKGYAAHAPSEKRDLGVISPTAALSSFPYTPEQSMAAMKHWYNDMKDKLWGPYGFYDAFSETANWYPATISCDRPGPDCCNDGKLSQWIVMEIIYELPGNKTWIKKIGI